MPLGGAAPRRQFIVLVAISGWHVDVDRLEQATPGVADFMPVAGLDEQHRPSFKALPVAIDDGSARPFHHIEPLVGAPVEVIRTSFPAAGGEDHDGALRSAVGDREPEPLPETELFAFHALASPWPPRVTNRGAA